MLGDGAFLCAGRRILTLGRASDPGAVRPRASGLSACSPQRRLRGAGPRLLPPEDTALR